MSNDMVFRFLVAFRYTVDISTAEIDPTALSNFLARHPNITSLSYEPEEDRIPTVLINPPVTLPKLQSICSPPIEQPSEKDLEHDWAMIKTPEHTHVICLDAFWVRNARAILPWLTLFPALTLAEFAPLHVYSQGSPAPDPLPIIEAFKAEAVAAFSTLPWVPHVVILERIP
ncbi:hypothetical protein C8R44DRAFT_745496 [Mycena epipterygia]|nr:hypothetical protein C8R44DRAFT_745496 [Mycena epipterygia]